MEAIKTLSYKTSWAYFKLSNREISIIYKLSHYIILKHLIQTELKQEDKY